VIAGRTAALKVEGTERACERARAYAACGVDCIFVIGVERAELVRAVREAGGLPVIVGSTAPGVTRGELQAAGARILLQGHQPLAAAVKAVREVYAHLRAGGDPAALKDRIASAADIDALTGADLYRQRIRDWMR
jgi:carboxyvinyl-carboxyphosphonate phosphorylmutase